MKINLLRFFASGLVMIGLTSIIVFKGIEPTLWNFLNLVFFEFVGMALLYNGLEKEKVGECK